MRKTLLNLIVISLFISVSGCVGLNLMKPTSSSSNTGSSTSPEDSAITNRVNSTFVKDAVIPAFDINVTTSGGIVTLKGMVNSTKIKMRATNVATTVKGVRSVRNQIRIK